MKKPKEITGPDPGRVAGSAGNGQHAVRLGGRVLSSNELFGTRNEVLIAHVDATYRLRITSQGKLILTK